MNMSTSQNKQKQQTLLARRPQYASSLVNSADCCSTAALLRWRTDALTHCECKTLDSSCYALTWQQATWGQPDKTTQNQCRYWLHSSTPSQTYFTIWDYYDWYRDKTWPVALFAGKINRKFPVITGIRTIATHAILNFFPINSAPNNWLFHNEKGIKFNKHFRKNHSHSRFRGSGTPLASRSWKFDFSPFWGFIRVEIRWFSW